MTKKKEVTQRARALRSAHHLPLPVAKVAARALAQHGTDAHNHLAAQVGATAQAAAAFLAAHYYRKPCNCGVGDCYADGYTL